LRRTNARTGIKLHPADVILSASSRRRRRACFTLRN